MSTVAFQNSDVLKISINSSTTRDIVPPDYADGRSSWWEKNGCH